METYKFKTVVKVVDYKETYKFDELIEKLLNDGFKLQGELKVIDLEESYIMLVQSLIKK